MPCPPLTIKHTGRMMYQTTNQTSKLQPSATHVPARATAPVPAFGCLVTQSSGCGGYVWLCVYARAAKSERARALESNCMRMPPQATPNQALECTCMWVWVWVCAGLGDGSIPTSLWRRPIVLADWHVSFGLWLHTVVGGVKPHSWQQKQSASCSLAPLQWLVSNTPRQ